MEDIAKLLTGLVTAAERTAEQASGNDKNDWNNFADALRELRDEIGEAEPKSVA